MERTDRLRLPRLIQDRFPANSWSEHRILLGVSGGSDSVALLHALLHNHAQAHVSLSSPDAPGSPATYPSPGCHSTPRIHVAHFNHHWRGSESDDDQRFVTDLCQRLGLELHVGHAPPPAKPAHATEESARRQRHRFLRETAERSAARFVLTAHTRDDQVETVLFRLLRGTGLRGLSGIRPRRLLSSAVTLVRPMLDASRQHVLDYLTAIGEPFREDSSNTDHRYLRNRIRHALLPLLVANYFPDSPHALVRLADQAGQLSDWLDEVVAQELDQCLQIQPASTPATELTIRFRTHQRPLIRVEMVRAAWRQAAWPEASMAERHWQALITPPDVQRWPATRSFPAHVTARWLDPGQLVLSRPQHVQSFHLKSPTLEGTEHHETP